MSQPIAQDRGAQLYSLIEELYPFCRSITGDGTRRTLQVLERILPLKRTSLPTGTKVLDWEIPKEWNINDAYIKNAAGNKIVDFRSHNLHIVNYSSPISAHLTLEQLRPHLFSLPDHPDWIPYRTTYYRESWGFCLPDKTRQEFVDGEYEVFIDSVLSDGELTWAEILLPGDSEAEVLIYTHICHPSMCNDNLSGIAVATYLAQSVRSRHRALSYRFVFAPTTIGAIAWLSRNEAVLPNISHGLVLASLGDSGSFVFKRSRRGSADVDRVVEYLISRERNGSVECFSPYGYDERQFCSPGFNLPVGRLTRTPNGRYPQYHTSADDLQFITPQALDQSLTFCERICHLLELNSTYVNLAPKGEPRLGPRGLYANVGGRNPSEFEHAILWVLNQSDGTNDLLGIAIKSEIDFQVIADAARALERIGLLCRIDKTISRSEA